MESGLAWCSRRKNDPLPLRKSAKPVSINLASQASATTSAIERSKVILSGSKTRLE